MQKFRGFFERRKFLTIKYYFVSLRHFYVEFSLFVLSSYLKTLLRCKDLTQNTGVNEFDYGADFLFRIITPLLKLHQNHCFCLFLASSRY